MSYTYRRYRAHLFHSNYAFVPLVLYVMTSSLICLLIMEILFLLTQVGLNKRTAAIAACSSEATASFSGDFNKIYICIDTCLPDCLLVRLADVAQQEAQLKAKIKCAYNTKYLPI